MKGWEMVEVNEWRDAVPQGVVWLPPSMIGRVAAKDYERMYREYLEALGNFRASHRQLLFGHTFFDPSVGKARSEEAGPDSIPQTSAKRIAFATVLRNPIHRLASQYDFDRTQAKSKVYQEDVRRSRGVLSFLDCARNETCRSANEFSFWCNLQTRYFCGFGADCDTGAAGGPTEKMLMKAKDNMETSFQFVGILEDWETTVGLVEELFPTFAEGISAALRDGGEKNCGRSWWLGSKKDCSHVKNRNERRDRSVEKEAGGDLLLDLRKQCWADLELYAFAKKKFEERAGECRERK